MLRKATVALAFVAFVIAGCREVTYKFPTEEYPLATPQDPVAPGDYKVAANFENKFEIAAKQQKGILVSPVMAWQTATLFLSGSSSDTYDKISKAMGVNLSHDTALAPTTQYILQNRKAGYKISHGLFFVWPIVPVKDFQGNAAVTLGADVVKLGSAGNGASQSLTTWIRKRANTGLAVQLDRNDMFVDYAVVGLPETNPGMTWQSDDGTPYKGTFRHADFCANVGPLYNSLGLPFAGKDKLHLDQLAQELAAEPIDGQFRQVITGPVPDSHGAWYRLVDPNGQILVCGNY